MPSSVNPVQKVISGMGGTIGKNGRSTTSYLKHRILCEDRDEAVRVLRYAKRKGFYGVIEWVRWNSSDPYIRRVAECMVNDYLRTLRRRLLKCKQSVEQLSEDLEPSGQPL